MLTGKLRTALLLAIPMIAACKTGLPSPQTEHWTLDSVPERMVKHFTGYRGDLDGSFRQYQYDKKKHVNRTLRRHFINNSPTNPFEANDPSQTNRRPPHSPAPDPLYYIGAEGIFIGLATLGMGGAFVPIPVDSLIATVGGGWGEFWRGFSRGAGGNAKNPPRVSDFQVKNR